MSKIKSALELAMEKTEGVVIDPEAFRRDNLKKEGRILASRYINREREELKTDLLKIPESDRRLIAEGMSEALMANLQLPRSEKDLTNLPFLEKGLLDTGLEKKTVQEMFRQLSLVFQQYLKSADQLTVMLKQQYEPQLRAKEQKLQQQTGQSIRIEPEQDPEFNRILADHLADLEEQYRQVLVQAREQLRKALP